MGYVTTHNALADAAGQSECRAGGKLPHGCGAETGGEEHASLDPGCVVLAAPRKLGSKPAKRAGPA